MNHPENVDFFNLFFPLKLRRLFFIYVTIANVGKMATNMRNVTKSILYLNPWNLMHRMHYIRNAFVASMTSTKLNVSTRRYSGKNTTLY